LTMRCPLTRTFTAKAEELTIGVVEKVKVAPPFAVDGIMVDEALEETEKSVANAVVEPEAPKTLITQEMELWIR